VGPEAAQLEPHGPADAVERVAPKKLRLLEPRAQGAQPPRAELPALDAAGSKPVRQAEPLPARAFRPRAARRRLAAWKLQVSPPAEELWRAAREAAQAAELRRVWAAQAEPVVWLQLGARQPVAPGEPPAAAAALDVPPLLSVA